MNPFQDLIPQQNTGMTSGNNPFQDLIPQQKQVTEKKPSFFGSIARDIIKPVARIGTNAVNAAQIIANKPTTQPFSGSYLGDVEAVGQSGNFGKDLKDSLGVGLQIASNLPVAKAGSLTVQGIKTAAKAGKLLPTLTKAASPLFKEGAIAGGGYGVGKGLEDNKTFGQTLGQGAIGAIGGGLTAPILGLGIPGAIRGVKNIPKIKGALTPEAPNIMNRVARLTPSDANKFKNLSGGKSHGEYLVETGNFGNPEQIIEKEAIKFTDSLNSVDRELEKLPGVHTSNELSMVLDDLIAREQRIGVPGEDSAKLVDLYNKNKQGGISMADSNWVKRKYEREVKLGYQRENNTEGIARATRLDDGLRKWQLETAKKLGLKNLDELNKQTQLSRFIVDKLGKQVSGKVGNEAINLTDWIILSGGDPTAIAAFLSKKLFLSKNAQSAFAELISKTPIKGQVEPKIGGSTGLPMKIPGVDYGTTMQMPGVKPPTIFEPPAQKINRSSSLPEQLQLSAPTSKAQGAPIILPTSVRRENLGLEGITQTSQIRQPQQGLLSNQINKSYTDIISQSKTEVKPSKKKEKIAYINDRMEEKVMNKPQFVYHGTENKNLKSILKSGLNTKDNYLGKTIGHAEFFARDDGNIFRINTDKLKAKDFKVDYQDSEPAFVYSKKIDPSSIEVKQNGKWTPLKSIKTSLKDKLKSIPNKQGGMIKAYGGEKDLTTKILKDLEGKTTVSKQYILDATNRGELKQVERDLIRDIVQREGDTVNVADFAKKVKAELLPLKVIGTGDLPGTVKGKPMFRDMYEATSLDGEIRGPVKDYKVNIYESPIATSAGDVHFRETGTKNYFGHTRIEDMADNKTRRVIEVQSDLYQKGNLDNESLKIKDMSVADMKKNGTPEEVKQWDMYSKKNLQNGLSQAEKDSWDKLEKNLFAKASKGRNTEVAKLQQYNDPTAHFRMVREEIKKAAQDGKTKLQFPTGETAMKIEGLGITETWQLRGKNNTNLVLNKDMLNPKMIGETVRNTSQAGDDWIITDVLGDGKFKAVPKNIWENEGMVGNTSKMRLEALNKSSSAEQFDISGKVDTNNPIYKFYEKDVQKYLNKFGGKKIVDDKGVSWIEVPIKKEYAKQPVEAFGKVALSPLFVGAGISTVGAIAANKLKKKEEVNEVKKPVKVEESINLELNEYGVSRKTLKDIETEYEIPKGTLSALLFLESTDGKNKKNADEGEMKWLTGLTEIAIKDLKREVDVSDPEDILKATAEYWKLLQKRNPTLSPERLYTKAYWTQGKGPQVLKKQQEFIKLMNKYKK